MPSLVCDTTILRTEDHSNLKEFRQAVKHWLIATHLNKSYTNKEQGFIISINKVCIGKISSSMGGIKAHALTVLHIAIEEAKLVEIQNDKRERLDIKNVYLFTCIVKVDSDSYEMWLYIRERREGMFLYSINLNNKKTL